jgi:hypothetical protein
MDTREAFRRLSSESKTQLIKDVGITVMITFVFLYIIGFAIGQAIAYGIFK